MPFAETAVARALLAAGNAAAPEGAIIVLAPPSALVPLARVATHALVPKGDALALVELRGVGEDFFATLGGIVTSDGGASGAVVSTEADLLGMAAALTAAKMAGAMQNLLELSLRYVQERQQFGRPLGKFQAIQHQIAVLAEQVVSAKMAARIGMVDAAFAPARVAAAKCRAGEASHQVCAIAHAVHGAIGVTAEYDLQLFTRRLKEWQLAFGSEGFWAARLGAARVAAAGSSADFARLRLGAL